MLCFKLVDVNELRSRVNLKASAQSLAMWQHKHYLKSNRVLEVRVEQMPLRVLDPVCVSACNHLSPVERLCVGSSAAGGTVGLGLHGTGGRGTVVAWGWLTAVGGGKRQ